MSEDPFGAAGDAPFWVIAEAIPQMVWSARPDGFHDYYNRQWYSYTGMQPGTTDGDAWNGMFHPDDQDRAWACWRHSLATGATYEIEYRLRHRTGHYRWVLGRALPLKDANGAVLRWMGTCTDVHDQKVAQEQLEALNRRKDEFLAMLAHELRNPLAPIISAAQLLNSEKPLPAEQAAHLACIVARQASHITSLVDDLLDVARFSTGRVHLKRAPVDLKQVIRLAIEQVRPIIARKGHMLREQHVDLPTFVEGDQVRLVQVVCNLLQNAAKYTNPGGTVQVALSIERDAALIEVHDNGEGIDASVLQTVFEPFSQAKRDLDRSEGGLGLGLALVRSLVAAHGGEVGAHSPGLGLGSTFSVRLPLVSAQGAAAVPARDRQRLDKLPTLDIVIVDDNLDALETMTLLLEMSLHRVKSFSDPFKVLAVAESLEADVFMLDVGLPGMSGLELVGKLRDLSRRDIAPAFIAITGYGAEADRQAVKKAGFDAHLVKPVHLEDLVATLSEVARNKHMEGA